ncbi:MAG: hypothetical protein AABX23_03485 [Nanoarchaeota archaeon]
MELSYILTEDEYRWHQGARGPLNINDGRRYWLQDPEFTQPFLEDVMSELIHLILWENQGAKVDDDGMFYLSSKGIHGGSSKERLPGVPTVPKLLEKISGLGFEVPKNYWSQIKHRLKVRNLDRSLRN